MMIRGGFDKDLKEDAGVLSGGGESMDFESEPADNQ
jgi:hypothetical protein